MERTTTDISVVEAKEYSRESATAAALAYLREHVSLSGTAKRESDDLNRTPPKPDPEADPEPDLAHCFYRTDDKAEAAQLLRESRKYLVQRFTAQYQYGNNSEQRYCVWNDNACPWLEKSSGIMWVAVHGANSVCVVTRSGDLDKTRKRGNLNLSSDDEVLSLFRKSIISEIEDLEDPSSEIRQEFQKCIKKPFGVVSANPGTNNIEQASDYDANKAIEFLEKKMKSDIDFDVSETTKTAIHAFQHLFRKKVKADEIEVSVMDPDCVYVVVTGQKRDANVEELSVGQIEMYLDDTIGESGLSEMDIPMRSIDHLLKNQKMSRETSLLSPGGSSNILETTHWYIL